MRSGFTGSKFCFRREEVEHYVHLPGRSGPSWAASLQRVGEEGCALRFLEIEEVGLEN